MFVMWDFECNSNLDIITMGSVVNFIPRTIIVMEISEFDQIY